MRVRTSRPCFSFLYRPFIRGNSSFPFRLLQWMLLPLSLPYLVVITLKRALCRRRDCGVPVVSVGNITVGGTGKTPVAGMLAAELCRAGKRVAVISSGTGADGGTRVGTGAAVGDDVASFGDEGVMLARRLPGVLFLKGKGKRTLARRAAAAGVDVVILDDGFHRYDIARTVDIVVLDGNRPFDNGFPIPAGMLRELPEGLRRADILVVNTGAAPSNAECGGPGSDQGSAVQGPAVCRGLARALGRHGKPVFSMRYAVRRVTGIRGERVDEESLRGAVMLAFAGTGNPFGFFRLLDVFRPEKVFGIVYPDHFAYSRFDVERLAAAAAAKGAGCAVTTEKDFVKVRGFWKGPPLYCIEIQPVMTGGAAPSFVDSVLQKVV